MGCKEHSMKTDVSPSCSFLQFPMEIRDSGITLACLVAFKVLEEQPAVIGIIELAKC